MKISSVLFLTFPVLGLSHAISYGEPTGLERRAAALSELLETRDLLESAVARHLLARRFVDADGLEGLLQRRMLGRPTMRQVGQVALQATRQQRPISSFKWDKPAEKFVDNNDPARKQQAQNAGIAGAKNEEAKGTVSPQAQWKMRAGIHPDKNTPNGPERVTATSQDPGAKDVKTHHFGVDSQGAFDPNSKENESWTNANKGKTKMNPKGSEFYNPSSSGSGQGQT